MMGDLVVMGMMLVEVYKKSGADVLFAFNGYFPAHGLNLILNHE
jgi:hypothetical protein